MKIQIKQNEATDKDGTRIRIRNKNKTITTIK